jgi:hypothetical protein
MHNSSRTQIQTDLAFKSAIVTVKQKLNPAKRYRQNDWKVGGSPGSPRVLSKPNYKIVFDEFEKINNATVINLDSNVLPNVNIQVKSITPKKSYDPSTDKTRRAFKTIGN